MFHAFPCSFSFLSGMLCFLSFFSSYYWPFWEFGACETIYLWLEIDVAQFCFWNRWDAILLISELGLLVLLDISLSLQNCCAISVIIWSVNIYIYYYPNMPVLQWRGNQIHSSEQSCRILLKRGDMLYRWCCRIIRFSGRYIGELGCFQGSLVLDLSSSLGLLEYLSWPCQMSYCPTFGWQRSTN